MNGMYDIKQLESKKKNSIHQNRKKNVIKQNKIKKKIKFEFLLCHKMTYNGSKVKQTQRMLHNNMMDVIITK